MTCLFVNLFILFCWGIFQWISPRGCLYTWHCTHASQQYNKFVCSLVVIFNETVFFSVFASHLGEVGSTTKICWLAIGHVGTRNGQRHQRLITRDSNRARVGTSPRDQREANQRASGANNWGSPLVATWSQPKNQNLVLVSLVKYQFYYLFSWLIKIPVNSKFVILLHFR